MMQHHKYSLTELDYMIPYEREIYVSLLKDHVQQENEKYAKEQNKAGMR